VDELRWLYCSYIHKWVETHTWREFLGNVVKAIKTGLKHVKLDIPVKTLDLVHCEYLVKQDYPGYPYLTGHPIGEFYKPVIAEFIHRL